MFQKKASLNPSGTLETADAPGMVEELCGIHGANEETGHHAGISGLFALILVGYFSSPQRNSVMAMQYET